LPKFGVVWASAAVATAPPVRSVPSIRPESAQGVPVNCVVLVFTEDIL